MTPTLDRFAHLPDQRFFVQWLQNFAALLFVSVFYLAIRQHGGGVSSLLLGAAVSAINFWLLSNSIPKLVRADLATAPSARTRRIVRRALVEFIGRYLVVGAVAYWGIQSPAMHHMALVLGLSLPIFAILIQGIRLLLASEAPRSISGNSSV